MLQIFYGKTSTGAIAAGKNCDSWTTAKRVEPETAASAAFTY